MSDLIYRDLADKMVFVTGPRQAGKTTLAKALADNFQRPLYLNYDSAADRQRMVQANWASTHDYVMLDEIHAMLDWKSYLKGVFDTKPANQSLLVTGSARLDTFRQSGESLAGSPSPYSRPPTAPVNVGKTSTSPIWCAKTCWSSAASRRCA